MDPRIKPLPPDEWDEHLAAILADYGPLNVFTTLARHPAVFRAWTRFGFTLLNGTIPARERELAILRTAHLRGSRYEWVQHVRLGRAAGLTDQEIEGIRGEHPWQGRDALVLEVTDELVTTGDLTDQTWQELCEHYDEPARIELLMLIGHYTMLAGVLGALRVQPEQ